MAVKKSVSAYGVEFEAYHKIVEVSFEEKEAVDGVKPYEVRLVVDSWTDDTKTEEMPRQVYSVDVAAECTDSPCVAAYIALKTLDEFDGAVDC